MRFPKFLGVCAALLFSLGTVGLVGLSPSVAHASKLKCRDCHEDHYQYKFSHFPAMENLCSVCHEASTAHQEGKDTKGVTTNRSQDTCYGCHERKDLRKHVHGAISMGEDGCLSCHNPHGSKEPYFARDKLEQVCLTCHDVPATGQSVHGPIKTFRSCAACHQPHSSEQPKLLPATGPALCLSCHNRVIRGATRVIPNIKEKLEKSPFVHAVAEECSDCHTPHASRYDRLLTAQFPAKDYNVYQPGNGADVANTYALCFNCHDQGLMNREITDETNFRNDVLVNGKIQHVNLHYLHVTNLGTTSGARFGKSCRICHDPHGAKQAKIIKDRILANGSPLKFEATATGGTCAISCHAPLSYQRQ